MAVEGEPGRTVLTSMEGEEGGVEGFWQAVKASAAAQAESRVFLMANLVGSDATSRLESSSRPLLSARRVPGRIPREGRAFRVRSPTGDGWPATARRWWSAPL